eukprot:2590849-Alexandrium_andersonii.AAC.1
MDIRPDARSATVSVSGGRPRETATLSSAGRGSRRSSGRSGTPAWPGPTSASMSTWRSGRRR